MAKWEHLTGFAVNRTYRQRLQLALVEFVAIAEMPGTLKDRADPVTGMMVRRDLRVGPDLQQLGVDPRLRGVAEDRDHFHS